MHDRLMGTFRTAMFDLGQTDIEVRLSYRVHPSIAGLIPVVLKKQDD